MNKIVISEILYFREFETYANVYLKDVSQEEREWLPENQYLILKYSDFKPELLKALYYLPYKEVKFYVNPNTFEIKKFKFVMERDENKCVIL